MTIAAERNSGLAVRASRRSRTEPVEKTKPVPLEGKALGWPAIAFIICVFLPWLWSVGALVISPFRVVLLVMTVPCLVMWVSGKAGGIRVADIAIIAYCLWCIISLTVVQGGGTGIQTGGVMFVEAGGAYMMGRCFVRGPRQFHGMVRLLFWSVAIIMPLAVVEAITHNNVSLTFLSKFSPTHVVSFAEPRWGLRRAQTVFEHPILFGVSTGAILAFVHLVLGHGRPFMQRWLMSGVVFLTAFLSMSSGPLTALIVQAGLLFWNWLLRKNEMRWRIMWGLVAAMYVVISLVSNQTVPEFLLTHFSFDQASAYYRVLIWHFGSESVMRHPLFGVGFGRWDRPDWMPPSIDMFWLYHAILFGLPAGILMMLTFLSSVISVARRKLDPERSRFRIAYLIVMTGYFLSGWTVHYWNATYVLFLFLLGSGAWLAESPAKAEGDRRDNEDRGRGLLPRAARLAGPEPQRSSPRGGRASPQRGRVGPPPRDRSR